MYIIHNMCYYHIAKNLLIHILHSQTLRKPCTQAVFQQNKKLSFFLFFWSCLAFIYDVTINTTMHNYSYFCKILYLFHHCPSGG